jgi:hypothetical protein
MSNLPSPPPTVGTDEWRRAIALMAAVDTHAESNTMSAAIRESNVINAAKKYETFLREGR